MTISRLRSQSTQDIKRDADQINKALVLNSQGDHDGAIRLLGQLALDSDSTFATEHLAKAALANLAK